MNYNCFNIVEHAIMRSCKHSVRRILLTSSDRCEGSAANRMLLNVMFYLRYKQTLTEIWLIYIM